VRVGAIDVGTNSVRLLVAEPQASLFRDVDRRLTITRLGQGVDEHKVLAPAALKRTLACIADYAAICGELAVERLRITGTSAVRDALNRDELSSAIRTLTGSELEMLTGDDEARLAFLGATSDIPETGPTLLIDIGGGSTELVLGILEPQRALSLDIGCVRMHERYLQSDPPTGDELETLRVDVTKTLRDAKRLLDVGPGTRFIGVAGTVTQLAALYSGLPVYDPDVTHHAVLTHGDVRRLARRLASLPLEQRRRVSGLVPGRADVIVAGAEILIAAMEVFDMAEVLVSEKDVLDGLILELLDIRATSDS
jgi:exopolyphosphatase / guanosine-5'-triphosphate,3'-diphosphate pyrophosphatase